MLPDYPKVKTRIGKRFHDKIRRAHDSFLGPPFDLPPSLMHEGETSVLHREDGSVEEIRPQSIGASGELRLDMREYEKLTLGDIDKLLTKLGQGLANEKGKVIMAAFERAVKEVGNVTDSSRPPLEQFFEAVEKVSMDFQDDGKPMGMGFHVGSEETAQKVRKVMEQVEETPNYGVGTR